MNTGKTVLSQLMDFLPIKEFRRCVECYNSNHHSDLSHPGINSCVWHSLNCHIGKAYETSNQVYGP